MFKTVLYNLVVLFLFCSCYVPTDKNKKEYNYYGIKHLYTQTYILDSFPNYGSLYDTLQVSLGKNISPVFVFENDTAKFKFCPINYISNSEQLIILDYHFNQVIAFQTDRIIDYKNQKPYPLDSLAYVMKYLYQKDKDFKTKTKYNNYRFIFLEVDTLKSIITTKVLLENIFFEFQKHKTQNDSLQLLIDLQPYNKDKYKIN